MIRSILKNIRQSEEKNSAIFHILKNLIKNKKIIKAKFGKILKNLVKEKLSEKER